MITGGVPMAKTTPPKHNHSAYAYLGGTMPGRWQNGLQSHSLMVKHRKGELAVCMTSPIMPDIYFNFACSAGRFVPSHICIWIDTIAVALKKTSLSNSLGWDSLAPPFGHGLYTRASAWVISSIRFCTNCLFMKWRQQSP